MKKDTKKEPKYAMAHRTDKGLAEEAYTILDDLLAAEHGELVDATVGIAWRYQEGEDADGHTKLGQAKLMGDFGYATTGYDVIIVLNYKWFNETTPAQRKALIDHELCHVAVVEDENEDPMVWADGRPLLRKRKHDLEEFHEIVARHSLWKDDIKAFVKAAQLTLAFGEKKA